MSFGVALAAISIGSSLYSAYQSNEANEATSSWETYNAGMSYLTAQSNIASQNALAAYNAQAVIDAADQDVYLAREAIKYNVDVIRATTEYNDQLYEEELLTMWEEAELDLFLLAQQRSAERGGIIATQAASGTLIGEGSNQQVIIDQMTQENLDAMVIQREADINATTIANARAQGIWEGEMAVQQTIWEGELSVAQTLNNAQASAASILTGQAISADAANYTAASQYVTDSYTSSVNSDARDQETTNNLVSGLFGAASTATSNYYQNAGTTVNTGTTTSDSLLENTSSSSRASLILE